MDPRTFYGLVKHHHNRQDRHDGSVTLYAIAFLGPEEPVPGHVIISVRHAPPRMFFDPERWQPVDGVRVREGGDLPQGCAWIEADRGYPQTQDAYPYFRTHLLPKPGQQPWPEKPAYIHTSVWIRAEE